MPIDFNTCNFCVWGFKHSYNTFRHIHEAFYRALKFKYPDRQVLWLDEQDDLTGIDFQNTFFIGMHMSIQDIPRLESCAYAIHNTDGATKEYFEHEFLINYGLYVSNMEIDSTSVKLARDTFILSQPWESYDAVVFRWGTDLLPHEIQANKPDRVFRQDSRVVNYVGSGIAEIEPFKQACQENGITFNAVGGFNRPEVSIFENVKLIQESYMAPAISNAYHCSVGYIPCRFFKNISYGQYPVTNNIHAYKLYEFGIFAADTRDLFYHAKESLQNVPVYKLYSLMDAVAKEHTYLNKVDALLTAAEISQKSRESR